MWFLDLEKPCKFKTKQKLHLYCLYIVTPSFDIFYQVETDNGSLGAKKFENHCFTRHDGKCACLTQKMTVTDPDLSHAVKHCISQDNTGT